MSSLPPAAAPRIATYERRVEASLARVWENVLDWEHLPWLHRSSFRSIALQHADASGWRAAVGLYGVGDPEIEIELQSEREARRYVTRTLSGAGAGSEIWTSLEPLAPRRTGVRVAFHVPALPSGTAAALGDAYVALYRRLWDEDEAMMVGRQAWLDSLGASCGAGSERVALGRLGDLRRRLPIEIEAAGTRFRIVEVEGVLVAHAVSCPHWGGPLDLPRDRCVTCPWHGYVFDVNAGRSADGRGLTLRTGEVEVDPATNEVSLVADRGRARGDARVA